MRIPSSLDHVLVLIIPLYSAAPNRFELSGQGYDHSISIRHASLVRCSDWLAGVKYLTPNGILFFGFLFPVIHYDRSCKHTIWDDDLFII